MPSQRSKAVEDIQVEEILVEDIPNPPTTYTHYYVDIEEKGSLPYNDSDDYITMAGPSDSQPRVSQPCTQFLRMAQIQGCKESRLRSEPLIDYSHSQILTFEVHVQKLKTIAKKKALAEKEKATT